MLLIILSVFNTVSKTGQISKYFSTVDIPEVYSEHFGACQLQIAYGYLGTLFELADSGLVSTWKAPGGLDTQFQTQKHVCSHALCLVAPEKMVRHGLYVSQRFSYAEENN